jgi:exodeoxyribonuclease III
MKKPVLQIKIKVKQIKKTTTRKTKSKLTGNDLSNSKETLNNITSLLKAEKKKYPKYKDTPYVLTSELKNESEFLQPTENTNLKIFSWNVNGIRAIIRKGNLVDFLNTENPDILCLNETKIDKQTLTKLNYDNLFNDKGYLSYWNCSEKKGYSGVAVLTKYKPIDVVYGLGQPQHDNEGRLLTLEYPSFYLLATYVPNASAGCRRLGYRVNEWDVALRAYFNELKSKKPVIICGDLNVAHNEIDLRHPKANEGSACFTKEERHSFGMHLESGFIDTFRHLYPTMVKYSYFCQRFPSCIAKNVGWRLDYFIVSKNAEERVVDSEILTQYRGSDHTPIKLTWKV